MKKIIAAAGIALVPAVALADVPGSVSADLNLREGPGTDYGVSTTIPGGSAVTIEGCLEGYDWCEVSYGGSTGYASSQYLLADTGGRAVSVREQPSVVDVVTAPAEAVGEAAGSVIGALGQAVGGVVGGVADAVTPEPEVVSYVRSNPVDPVYLDGDLVVGAGVPEQVPLREVPQQEYRYAYINDRPVLVDPGTRRVVYVYE